MFSLISLLVIELVIDCSKKIIKSLTLNNSLVYFVEFTLINQELIAGSIAVFHF